MTGKHLTPQQYKVIPELLQYALSLKGKTIDTLEKESNKQYRGDKEQEAYRDQEIWHKKKDLDRYVATRLHLSSALYGKDKVSPDFITCTARQLAKICKNGIASKWSKQKPYQIFRLNDLDAYVKNPAMDIQQEYHVEYQYDTSEQKLKEIFLTIISRGKKDNTYKFVLAKTLLDYCRINTSGDQDHRISYDYLAKEFLKHYWHQRYKFNIKQDPHVKKQPVVITALEDVFGTSSVGSFEQLDPDKVKKATTNIRKRVFGLAKNKNQMVVSKFQNIPHGTSTENVPVFYDYDDESGILRLKQSAFYFFKKNYGLLSRALLAEWTRQLEQFNYSLPKLVAKIDFENAIRASLSPYRRAFEPYTDHCFYCLTKLEPNYIHVDHLIPWSYIFADEAWNLVLSCQHCNLRKHDSLPQEEFRDELIVRNSKYYEQILQLKRSCDQLNTGKGWIPEIKNHYNNCLECGFSEIHMP